MITKRQLADQIILLLGRATPDFRVDIREIRLNVGQERDLLLTQEYMQMLAAGEREIPAEWCSTFTVAVQHDTVRNRDYVQLPVEPLRLPGDVGLHSIAPAGDEFNAYVPVANGALGLIRNHPAFALSGRVGYWREMGAEAAPSRAWFKDAILATSPDVLAKIVCPSASLGDDAPFPISAHIQALIIDRVRQRYSTKPAPDKVSDDVDQK